MTLIEITDFLVTRYTEALMRLTKYEKTGLKKVELDEVKKEIEALRAQSAIVPTLEVVTGYGERNNSTAYEANIHLPPEYASGVVVIGDELTGEETRNDKSNTGTRGKRTKSSKRNDGSTPSGQQ